MTRHLTRAAVLTAAAAALCVAVPGPARGQGGTVDLKPYRMEDVPALTSETLNKLNELSKGSLRVGGPNLKANQDLFKRVATYYAQKVTHAQYYTYPETGELAPKNPVQTLDYQLNDLAARLLVPTAGTEYTTDQAEYIREFGAALDRAIVDVLTRKNPPPIIRVNAARLLAVAARSGAPAHARTILALLTNKFYTFEKKPADTPPEVLYWAIKAAENLLAAYDPVAFRIPGSPPRHSIPEGDLVQLVQVLDDMVLKGPNVASRAAPLESEKTVRIEPKNDAPAAAPVPAAPTDPAAPKGPAPAAPPGQPAGQLAPSALTPEQVALVTYYRKAAVRALAKVRYDTLGGAAGIPLVRPGFTLARVAVNDAALSLPVTTAEVGEAVIGLCGLQPSTALNQPEWLYAVAYGTNQFAQVKSGNADDKTVPWRLYAARMQGALDGLTAGSRKNARLSGNQKLIQDLASVLTSSVLAPLEKAGAGGAQVNLDALNAWLEQNVPKGDRSLFTEGPPAKLSPRSTGG